MNKVGTRSGGLTASLIYEWNTNTRGIRNLGKRDDVALRLFKYVLFVECRHGNDNMAWGFRVGCFVCFASSAFEADASF